VLKLKTLYIRNVVEDLIKKKKAVAAFIGVCVVLFAFLGVRQGNKAFSLSEEQQKEIEEYQAKIDEYDAAIADAEKCIEESDKQIESLQEYVDNSIYMQIDPQNIQTVSTQYSIQTGGNVGNIYNSFITYINDGGLKETLPEEYKNLKVEYWREIVSSYQTSNTLTIVVIHHDAAQAQQIMDLIKERILAYVPQVKTAQGDFTLTEMGTSSYTKADVGITNTQNNNRNNLKSYTNSRADYHNKVNSLKNTKDSFIKNNEPESLNASAPNKVVTIIKYIIAGILFGVVIPCACIVLRYVLSDRLRSADDLRDSNLNVIGKYKDGKGHLTELERSIMDIQALAEEKGMKSVFLNLLSEDPLSAKVAAEYEKAMTDAGLTAKAGAGAYEHADVLKQMISCGSCILFAQAGKTTYQQLEQQMKLCERFKILILGCVVME